MINLPATTSRSLGVIRELPLFGSSDQQGSMAAVNARVPRGPIDTVTSLPSQHAEVAFGTSHEQQTGLAALVAMGVKRATTSESAAYREEGEPLPQAGGFAAVVDGSGSRVCTIRTTSVEVRRCAEVDEAHAWAEGEGDRTLAAWRLEHRSFLAEVCGALGVPLDDDRELVLERFEVV